MKSRFMVKYWSNVGQKVVKRWTKVGQKLVKWGPQTYAEQMFGVEKAGQKMDKLTPKRPLRIPLETPIRKSGLTVFIPV
jgi:hypothetical protein